MAFYIVVDNATGIIDNRIVLDDPEQWEVPAGHTMIEETGEPMAIGGSYIDGVYTPPPGPPPTPPLPDASAIVDQSYRAGLVRQADQLQAHGKSYDAMKLLFEANS